MCVTLKIARKKEENSLTRSETDLVLVSVLVEGVGDVLAVPSDGQEALLHVEGAAGDEDEVEAALGAAELPRLGVHPVPDVHGAAGEGHVVLAAVEVGVVSNKIGGK